MDSDFMSPEEVTEEFRSLRKQLSTISGDLKALVNETKNQSKIKNNLNTRLTLIEQDRGPTRKEYTALERRLDFIEAENKVKGKESNIYKAAAYFILNSIFLLICACIGSFI